MDWQETVTYNLLREFGKMMTNRLQLQNWTRFIPTIYNVLPVLTRKQAGYWKGSFDLYFTKIRDKNLSIPEITVFFLESNNLFLF